MVHCQRLGVRGLLRRHSTIEPGCESACAPYTRGAPASLVNPHHTPRRLSLPWRPALAACMAPSAPDAADIPPSCIASLFLLLYYKHYAALLSTITRAHTRAHNTRTPAHATPGGHYSAHVQQPDGRWLHFNDAAVSPVSLHHVLSEKTYVLVYQKA